MDKKYYEKINDLHPVVAEMAKELVKRLESYGMKPIVTQGYRTIAEQNALYAKGRRGIKGEKVVTNAKGGQSYHNYRIAFDLAFLDDPSNLYNVDWNFVGKIGKECGLEWGGDWIVFKDRPHFQLTGGLSIKELMRSNTPMRLIDEALAQYGTEKQQVSPWAQEAVDFCMDPKNSKTHEPIASDFSRPQDITPSHHVEIMLYRAGIISTVTGDGINKERWAKIIYDLLTK